MNTYSIQSGICFLFVLQLGHQCFASETWAEQKWRRYLQSMPGQISGLALIKQDAAGSTFLIAHDNKFANEARLAVMTVHGDKLGYDPISWPDAEALPSDIEAGREVPGNGEDDFLVMTSGGGVTHITVDASNFTMKINSRFTLPGRRSGDNLEGLALHHTGKDLFVAWAHRGNSQDPGMIYWGIIDLATQTVDQQGSHPFRVTWPERPSVRHIADMVIDTNGVLYVSSTSDPGNDGPFGSAIYKAGAFTLKEGGAQFEQDISSLYRTESHKIEGFDRVGNGFALATDDENMGSSFLLLP